MINFEQYVNKYKHIRMERRDGILQLQMHTNGETVIWGTGPHEELGYCFSDIGADPENLVHMKRIADKLFGDSYAWSILAAGRHQLPLVSMGAIMGGNVRVGLEDSLWIGRGKLATSNADQVSAIRAIVENLSLEIASPDEARAMLALKGGDAVAF